MDVVAVVGAVDACEHGTTDHGTRATMNDARPEATAKRATARTHVTRETWKWLDPVTRELRIGKRTLTFQWLRVVRSGFLWLF